MFFLTLSDTKGLELQLSTCNCIFNPPPTYYMTRRHLQVDFCNITCHTRAQRLFFIQTREWQNSINPWVFLAPCITTISDCSIKEVRVTAIKNQLKTAQLQKYSTAFLFCSTVNVHPCLLCSPGTRLWRPFGIPLWHPCCHLGNTAHLIPSDIPPRTPQTALASPKPVLWGQPQASDGWGSVTPSATAFPLQNYSSEPCHRPVPALSEALYFILSLRRLRGVVE